MSEPSARRVDLSETTVAHELFGTLWGLVFLGATGRVLPLSVPLEIAIGDYVEQRKASLDDLLAHLQAVGGLSEPSSMALFDEERTNTPTVLTDADAVGGRLLLYSRNLAERPVDLGDEPLVRRLVTHGVDCQLRSLVDTMIRAVSERQPVEPELLSALHGAAVNAAQLGGAENPRAAVRRAYDAWRIADLGNMLAPDSGATNDARAALRRTVERLDPLF